MGQEGSMLESEEKRSGGCDLVGEKRMSVAGFLWKLDIKVKVLSQFPHLCGRTTSNRVVKNTRTFFFMHYLLRCHISSVQETEKTAELGTLTRPQKCVCLGKGSAGTLTVR